MRGGVMGVYAHVGDVGDSFGHCTELGGAVDVPHWEGEADAYELWVCGALLRD